MPEPLIKFTRGVPPVESFPTAQLSQCATAVLSEHGDVVLQYGPARGFPALRAHIAEGMGVPTDRVIVGQGSLQLLDALHVVYYPLIHGATRIMRFELGVSLVLPLVILYGLWTVWVVQERNLKIVIFPAVALVALPFLGLDAFISIASLLAVVAGLWYHRDVSKFLRGTFLLLC